MFDFIYVNSIFDHMRKTFFVMLDRSIWFTQSHKFIVQNEMSEFIDFLQVNSDNKDKEQIESSLNIAYGYSSIIFLCSALELTLLHHYINSYAFFNKIYSNNIMPELKKLIEKRNDVSSWKNWCSLPDDKKFIKLKEISMSNISNAETLFSDIYGKDCFKTALGLKDLNWLIKVSKDLQTKRNGIVHRGGEFKNGQMIKIDKSELYNYFNLAKEIRDKILVLSEWFRKWWLNKLA